MNGMVGAGPLLLFGALLLPLVGRVGRQVLSLVLPLAALAICAVAAEGPALRAHFLDFTLVWVDVGTPGRLFAIAFCIAAFAGGLFAVGRADRLEMTAALVCAGGAVGAVLAGDLITFLVFWELMAIGSTVLVWCGRTAAAVQAGIRYAGIHLAGGVLLTVGIAGQVATSGSAALAQLSLDGWPQWLILAGILVNAAAFPLSAWLPDAYPESSPTGMVFLSVFTTKTAVYALLRLFPGTELLIPLGFAMVLYGLLYAVREGDIRRLLAYSIVAQVGTMLVGIGIGTAMALNGTAAHAFVHALYAALLVMAAGAVITMTGRRNAADLGGLWRSMPVTMACCVVGMMAMAGLPLTAGFVTKSMIAQAAGDEGLLGAWLLLTAAASAGTLVYLAVPWFLFFQRDSGLRPPEAPATMRAAMLLLALITIGIGIWPGQLYNLLPYGVEYTPYTADHVAAQIQIVGAGALAFFLGLRFLQRRRLPLQDVDWLWRGPGLRAAAALTHSVARLSAALRAAATREVVAIVGALSQAGAPTGHLGRTVPVSRAAVWVVLLLLAFLVLQLT